MSRRDQRGLSMSVEAVVLIPALLLVVGLLLVLARVAIADQHVGVAAGAGARAASLERTPAAGERAARAAVVKALGDRGVACRHTSVMLDTSGLTRALGERARVSVEVGCSVDLSDVSLPFMPGTVAVSATRTSPVDPLRGG